MPREQAALPGRRARGRMEARATKWLLGRLSVAKRSAFALELARRLISGEGDVSPQGRRLSLVGARDQLHLPRNRV